MEFRDLKTQYKKLKEEVDASIIKVMEQAKYISGPEVKELETALAEYVGTKHCITCANGTDAMELILRAWGIGEKDAVFVPSFTFMSTAEVVATVGAQPIFVDIDPDTFNMDPQHLEHMIIQTKQDSKYNIRAIIPVDLFGLPADYDQIGPIARKYSLKILEDGAQGFGGAIRGKRACSFGDAATTSFFPAKPLGCYGDGGAMFTDDDELAALLRSLSVHGKGAEKYDNIRIGRNSRLDTIQAAVLKIKLKAFLEYELEAVNKLADEYNKRLYGIVKTPKIPEGYYSSWAQYTILLKNEEQRYDLRTKLNGQGIPVMIYYQKPLHLQTAFAYCGVKVGTLPVSEEVSRCVLSLPIHPYMSKEEVFQIFNIIKGCSIKNLV